MDGWLAAAGVNDAIHSLIIDGIFAGVGSVISFLPIIVTLFFFLSLLAFYDSKTIKKYVSSLLVALFLQN